MSEVNGSDNRRFLVIKEACTESIVWVDIYDAGYLRSHDTVSTSIGGLVAVGTGVRIILPQEEIEIQSISDGWADN